MIPLQAETVITIAKDLSEVSAFVLTLVFVIVGMYALHRKWIVLGWTYNELKEDRDRQAARGDKWQEEAFELLRVAKTAVDVTDRVTKE